MTCQCWSRVASCSTRWIRRYSWQQGSNRHCNQQEKSSCPRVCPCRPRADQVLGYDGNLAGVCLQLARSTWDGSFYMRAFLGLIACHFSEGRLPKPSAPRDRRYTHRTIVPKSPFKRSIIHSGEKNRKSSSKMYLSTTTTSSILAVPMALLSTFSIITATPVLCADVSSLSLSLFSSNIN